MEGVQPIPPTIYDKTGSNDSPYLKLPCVSSSHPLNRVFPESVETENEHTLCPSSLLAATASAALPRSKFIVEVSQSTKCANPAFQLVCNFPMPYYLQFPVQQVSLTLLSHHPPVHNRYRWKPHHIPSRMDRYLFLRPSSHHRRRA